MKKSFILISLISFSVALFSSNHEKNKFAQNLEQEISEAKSLTAEVILEDNWDFYSLHMEEETLTLPFFATENIFENKEHIIENCHKILQTKLQTIFSEKQVKDHF